MERNSRPLRDHVRIIIWFIIVVLFFIACLGIINGQGCGYKNSLIGHGILGLIVGGCLVILLAACIILNKCIEIVVKGKRAKGK